LKQPRQLKHRLQTEKELLLTSDGRPVAILLNIESTEDPEAILQSVRDSRSRLALSRIRDAARKSGANKFSATQIEHEISAARKLAKSR
jgi:hypothetical protein